MMILEHSRMEFSTANQNEVESSRLFQIVHDASGTFSYGIFHSQSKWGDFCKPIKLQPLTINKEQ